MFAAPPETSIFLFKKKIVLQEGKHDAPVPSSHETEHDRPAGNAAAKSSFVIPIHPPAHHASFL
jgi:hypothetical protein